MAAGQPGTSMSDADQEPNVGHRDLVPRPMAGYESPLVVEERLSQTDLLRLLAACARAAAGVLFAAMPLLYLPTQFWTPIMSGIGLIMVVNGSLAVWTVGRDEPRLKPLTGALTWLFPAGLIAVFLTGWIFGPGILGPDWDAMRARREQATWQPRGL